MREEFVRLEKENSALHRANQELQERLERLECLGGNVETAELEQEISDLKSKLKRKAAQEEACYEEIHTLRERVSELEVTYLGGYRD